MVIQHNIPALNSHRNLGINNSATAKNLEKLSSGYRINRAGDDAAGLAISEKMRGQIRGLAMAEQNAENGISLIQTAEGGLNETHDILQRMRELAVQASNGTYQDEDRAQIALEVEALKSEIDRIATSTHYNGIKLLDGTTGGVKIKYQTGSTTPGLSVYTEEALANNTDINSIWTTLTVDFTTYATAKGESATITVTELKDGTTIAAMQVGDVTGIHDGTAFIVTNIDGTTYSLGTMGGTAAGTLKGGTTISGLSTEDAAAAAGNRTGVIAGSFNEGVTIATAESQLIFQIGANGGADQRVGLHVDNMSTGALGDGVLVVAQISINTREKANEGIEVLNAAINQVSDQRAKLGALQNRLEHTLNNLGVTKENLTAAESTIRDVDMAKEMMDFTKNNILVQASQAMLAQANALPQGVLSLLR